jgi:hypothetical protein
MKDALTRIWQRIMREKLRVCMNDIAPGVGRQGKLPNQSVTDIG